MLNFNKEIVEVWHFFHDSSLPAVNTQRNHITLAILPMFDCILFV